MAGPSLFRRAGPIGGPYDGLHDRSGPTIRRPPRGLLRRRGAHTLRLDGPQRADGFPPPPRLTALPRARVAVVAPQRHVRRAGHRSRAGVVRAAGADSLVPGGCTFRLAGVARPRPPPLQGVRVRTHQFPAGMVVAAYAGALPARGVEGAPPPQAGRRHTPAGWRRVDRPTGTVRFVHQSREPADRPSVQILLDMARQWRSAPTTLA